MSLRIPPVQLSRVRYFKISLNSIGPDLNTPAAVSYNK
eukprot:SAG31_NODE_25867_length_452_cov_1.215297_1_plen_37_part_10